MCEKINIACAKCDETFTENKFFGAHVRFKHGYKAQDYYDKYIAVDGDGICVVCGKECKFFALSQGYAKTCSNTCAQLNPATRKKIESTNIKKYGVKAPAMSKKIQAKTKATNMERYGVEVPYQLESIKNKGIDTVKEKYGVDNVFQLDNVKEKSKETMLDKYGVELNILRPEVKEHIKRSKRKTKYPEFIDRLKLKNVTYLGTEDSYIHDDCIRSYQCGYCDKIFDTDTTMAYDVQCGCLRRRSKGEWEINEWLTSLGYVVKQSEFMRDDEGRLEIDLTIYLENGTKVGIEYCGLYWHSELYRPREYHKRKLDAAIASGIRLLQIFEDEWLTSKELVKSMILSIIGDVSVTKIGARKCKLIKFNKTPKDFINDNHIQGNVNGKHSYGLLHNDEIVAVIVFGKNRYSSGWECLRFCNKQGYTILGGFSRLLKAFIKEIEPDLITSYADLRLFTGNVYLSSGFKLMGHKNVGYFYLPPGCSERLNRMKFQKHKLKNMTSYSSDKTEHEIMLTEGYVRLYDAGQATYIWKNNT